MKTCCVEGCTTASNNITFFKFPGSRVLRKRWLQAVRVSGRVTLSSLVCSRHFREADYEVVRGKKRLKRKVVPVHCDGDELHSVESKNTDVASNSATDNGVDSDTTISSSKKQDDTLVSAEVDAATVLYEQMTDEREIVECTPETPEFDNLTTTTNELHKEDIEDILAHYQIQNNHQHKRSDTPEKLLAQIDPKSKPPDIGTENKHNSNEDGETIRNENAEKEKPNEVKETEKPIGEKSVEVDVKEDSHRIVPKDRTAEPIFIEVSFQPVSTDLDKDPSSPEDCMMLLENVQVEVDPNTLLPPEPDSDVEFTEVKKDDPISLLTSSDEDDVIIQEPKIDTVEVSDETDEDDIPLVRLMTASSKERVAKAQAITEAEETLKRVMWGMYEYYCVQCHFRTLRHGEFTRHVAAHSTAIQICQTCNYTTASQTQFARHKRKHKEEKRYKCHLCEYKARHSMSLTYHMKSHDKRDQPSPKNFYKCDKCSFESPMKSQILKHLNGCLDDKVHSCNECDYKTKRKNDLKRHMRRKHADRDEDDDYIPPSWA